MVYLVIGWGATPALRAQTAPNQTWPAAKAAREATLLVYALEEPPFVHFEGPDSATGIEPDLLRAFVDYARAVHGVRLRLQFVRLNDFQEIFRELDRGLAGAIAIGNISILESRARRFDYTQPYLPDVELLVSSNDVPLVPPGSEHLYKEVFAGCTALTGPGSTTLENFEWLKREYLPDLVIDTAYSDVEKKVRALGTRKKSLAYLSLVTYLHLLPQLPELRRRRLFSATREGLALLLPEGSTWRAPIDDFLDYYKRTGRLKDLLIEQLGPEAEQVLNDYANDTLQAEGKDLLLTYREKKAMEASLEVTRERAARQRLVLWGLALISLIVVAFGVVLLRQARFRKRVNRQLLNQNEELEAQRRQLSETLEELRATQDELVRAEKLSVMGELVANVAHQLNSPIGALRSSVSYVQQQLPHTFEALYNQGQQVPPAHKLLFLKLLEAKADQRNAYNRMTTRERRAARQALAKTLPERLQPEAAIVTDALLEIGVFDHAEVPEELQGNYRDTWRVFAQVGRLLASAHNVSVATERTSRFVQLLRFYVASAPPTEAEAADTVQTLERLFGEYAVSFSGGVQLVRDYGGHPIVGLAPDWLEVVLRQPLINAIQALQGRGTLRVAVSQIGGFGVVAYHDTGPGIAPELLPKLFEPFTTTKAGGEGLGLGLYLVKRTLTHIGGSVDLESTEGTGTTVTLHIPLYRP